MEHSLETAVAWIDLLGFKSLLKKMSLKKIRDVVINDLLRLANFGKFLTNHDLQEFSKCSLKESPEIKCLHFSDTIILYIDVPKNSSKTLKSAKQKIESLSFAVYSILNNSVSFKLPLRGAISFGNCLFTKDPLSFIGLPIYEAFEYTEKQNWVGVILSPSAEKLIDNKKLPSWLVKYKVPFKEEKHNKNIIVVNWIKYLTLSPKKIFSLTKNKKINEKITNTRKFYSEMIKKRGYTIVKDPPIYSPPNSDSDNLPLTLFRTSY